ncbi:MAG: PKD domain-containing protein [Caldilineaceae bacterium]
MKPHLKRAVLLYVTAALLLLALTGVALAAGEVIPRAGSGAGGGSSTNGQTTVRSAFGQPVVGVVGNAQTTLCSGFACGMGVMADDPITALSASNDGPTVLGAITTFNATATGGSNVTYAWDFGDGNSGSGASPAHIYAATGAYTATVTASNGAGSLSAQTVVEVSNAVVEVRNFLFDPTPVTIPRGGRVTWVRIEGNHNVRADDDGFSSGPPSSTWITYSRRFETVGTFPYYCELHGGPGGAGMSGVVIVEESTDTPITGLTAANDGPTVLGAPTAFTAATASGSNVSYSWTFGDGTGATGPAPQHTYAAAGTYVATVTAINDTGSMSAQTTVEVSHAVVEVRNFEFVPGTVTINPGQRVTWVLIEGTHNVVADDGSFTSGPPSSAWTTYTETFATVGDYPYYCALHGGPGGSGMSGRVLVREGTSSGDEKVFLPLVYPPD